MKKIIILSLLIAFLTSCVKKRCYTCKLYRETNTNSNITIDSSITVEKCKVSEEEVKQYQKDNYYYEEKPLNSYFKKTMVCK